MRDNFSHILLFCLLFCSLTASAVAAEPLLCPVNPFHTVHTESSPEVDLRLPGNENGILTFFCLYDATFHRCEQRQYFLCSICNVYTYVVQHGSHKGDLLAPHAFRYIDRGCIEHLHTYRAICTDCLYGMDVVLPCTGEPHAVPAN